MRTWREWFRRRAVPETVPVVSMETLTRLADAVAVYDAAQAEARERASWVDRLRAARQDNHLGARMRQAFDSTRDDGDA